MDLFDAIYGRRSIRQFTPEAVSDERLMQLLKAAMAAPSAGNEQPWHFVVVSEREKLDAITKFHPYANALETAPLGIVVCGDLMIERYEGFWVQDCSAAIENLLLAAYALGLGTVWLAGHPVEDRCVNLRRLLGIPANVVPLAIIAVGHPAETKPPVDRFNMSRIHRDKW